MPLEVKGMTRSFKFKKGTEYVTLADPGTDFTPDMVLYEESGHDAGENRA